MKTHLCLSAATGFLALTLLACSPAVQSTEAPQASVQTEAKTVVESEIYTSGANIAEAVAGTYTGDETHTYVGLTYMHQGYARATLRVDNVQLKLDLNTDDPEQSQLMVMMKTENISTGIDKFDEHLMSADFFDAANYPDMTFNSTSMTMINASNGTVTGDLTLKGVTKPVSLEVTLNKVGQHFRTKADMIGISAKGAISRTEFGLGKYAPVVGDTVTLTIEAEMAIAAE